MQPQASLPTPSTALPALLSEYLAHSKPELFELGQTVCTRNVVSWAADNLPEVLLEGNLWACILVRAHSTGCWDELDKSDQRLNYASLEPGNEGRILSAYTLLGEKIYVITEADRSVTTVLLADDY
ncbi:hypothetical protein [Neisseria sp. S1]|uniref:hypothetical protein n=1 Tax=Neisseria sp. S1 TaxID=3318354 RepID=UPI003A8C3F8F